MGIETNARWMHSVRTDKRPEIKDPAGRGPRISLTFNSVTLGTFLAPVSPSPSGVGPRALQGKCSSSFSDKARQ